MLRVRFAPSPTGYLHVGGARTALFNWLLARGQGGTFVLRIEDTDTDRSSWEMVAGIVDGLRWLGLDWDEGPDVGGPHAPYYQSQRLPLHQAYAERLVAGGHAYYCYCTAEQIRVKREAAEAGGGGWIYDRTCCALTAEEITDREGDGQPRAVRFKVPEGQTTFTDLVHGPITFANANVEDFVILRSDGQPTYHLSVVADDIDMAISHVIRGDDHISNTPKHVLLFEALGAPTPQFAHVPLILGPDKKRLSKRHGATSVTEYARLGYVPEAMVNFLALLGWSPGSDEELFTRAKLAERFTLSGVSGGNAVFNHTKLDWFNQQHLMRMPVDGLASRIEPFLRERGWWRDGFNSADQKWLYQVIDLLRPRVKRLDQFLAEGQLFFSDDVEFDAAAVVKFVETPRMAEHLAALAETFREVGNFEAGALELTLRAFAEEKGLKAAALIQATRVALAGRAASPGLFEVLELLGRERSVSRLVTAAALTTPS